MKKKLHNGQSLLPLSLTLAVNEHKDYSNTIDFRTYIFRNRSCFFLPLRGPMLDTCVSWFINYTRAKSTDKSCLETVWESNPPPNCQKL